MKVQSGQCKVCGSAHTRIGKSKHKHWIYCCEEYSYISHCNLEYLNYCFEPSRKTGLTDQEAMQIRYGVVWANESWNIKQFYLEG